MCVRYMWSGLEVEGWSMSAILGSLGMGLRACAYPEGYVAYGLFI